MNVIIPMMGIGKRFTDADYIEDKPFIKVNGKLLIELVVQPLYEMYGKVYIACRRQQADRLSKVFSSEVVQPIVLDYSKGAAHTIYQSCKHIGEGRVLCVDSDTIVTTEALQKIGDTDNAILTFKDELRTGIYSYVELGKENKIKKIVEKDAISDVANAGIYLFTNKYSIVSNYKDVEGKEQYLSSIVANSIKNKNKFVSIDISNQFSCLGTPHQLQAYAKKKSLSGMVFCFDLDKTLVYDVLKNPNPIQKNVDYCNYLYDNGAKIIIHTARGMVSYNGNKDSIMQFLYPMIKKVLSNNGIKYHELIVGKPYADYYIDDKAISSYRDLQKETGVYYAIDTETRSHHEIHIQSDIIKKSGDLASEDYYYKYLPKELLDKFFPNIISSTPNEIVMERIKKPTYSYSLLLGALTSKDIINLLNRAYDMHMYNPMDITNWGYTEKVLDRYNDNVAFYNRLGCTDKDIENIIVNNMPTQGGIIHGDLVFTNVFDDKFIDPRGSWDGVPSIYGDIHYDYAKILQSLYGYDYALNNVSIQTGYLKSLRETFKEWYKDMFGNWQYSLLQHKTRLLIISMLPLHKEDIKRCERFIQLLNDIQ